MTLIVIKCSMRVLRPDRLILAAQWYRRQQRVLLASQRARWEHEQATLAQFTVSESFTLGWLNVLLRHLWPTVIEKEVAEVAAANIRVSTVCLGVGAQHFWFSFCLLTQA